VLATGFTFPDCSRRPGGFNRVYTDKTRMVRGLNKTRLLKLCDCIQSAEADLVCIDAVSTAVSSMKPPTITRAGTLRKSGNRKPFSYSEKLPGLP